MMTQKQIDDIEEQKEEMRAMLLANVKVVAKIKRMTDEEVNKKIEDILSRTAFLPRC